MLPLPLLLSTFAFLSITYPLISFIFSSRNVHDSRKSKLWLSFAVIGLIYAIKLGYELQHVKPNYYQLLNTPRSSSTLEIRQAYKKVSKIYHPDKNTASDAEERFQAIKKAYDVLMDEKQRDIYNRFGDENLEFDPRQDEIKLLTETVVVFLGWGVTAYTFTIPSGARSCRTWVAIGGLVLLALEIAFILTESVLPSNLGILPKFLTEYEFNLFCHSLFSLVIAALRCLGEAYYVDADKTSILVLEGVIESQKKMDLLLQHLQQALSRTDTKIEDRLDVKSELEELQQTIETNHQQASKIVEDLKNSSNSIGSNYYWIVFVVMYGGIYLLQ